MPRNLSLNISVGALLDNSVGRVFTTATRSANELGQEHRRLNQELNRVRSVRRYADRLGELQRQAREAGTVSQALARRIQNAETRFAAASADARRYGVNIDNIGQAEERLNRQLEQNNRALRMRERLGAAGQGAKRMGAAAGQGLMTGGMIGGTALGAGLAAITATNKMAAEQANLAAAVGLSQKQLSIWSGIVSQAGFDSETVIDLVEELNNKFGESKGLHEQTTAVSEAMSILRLDFDKLKKLKPDEQFQAIVEATQRIGGQEAVSAADILLGGEANKIIGYLNSLDQPVGQLFERFEKLYIGSNEGLEGAKIFSSAFGELTFTLGKAFQELAGVVGAQLAPQMQEWASSMAESFKGNKDKITEFASTIGSTLAQLGAGFVSLAENLPTIIKAMTKISGFVVKWFGDDEEKEKQQEKKKNYALGLSSVVETTTAQRREPSPQAVATSNAMAEAMKRQAPAYHGYGYIPMPVKKPTATAPVEDANQQTAAPILPTAQVNQDNRMNVSINIQQQPGESSARVAEKVKQKIESIQTPTEPVPLYADPGALG